MPIQCQATKQGGPFALVEVPSPKPGAKEVCIRPKAIGLNPLDWKSHRFGVMIQSWPTVLGVDGAGIVESVGEEVTSFKAGDEVMSLAGFGIKAGSFQEIYTVPEYMVSKKPSALSFEAASSLPICFLTAAAGIIDGLKIPLRGLGKAAPTGKSPESILILGGSSAIGAAAIQLLRLTLPSATIIATSSAVHHSRLLSLGASKCLERAAQDDVAVLKAATPGGAGVDVILDPVVAAASQPAVFGALKADGPKLYSQPITGANPKVPEGVQATQVMGRQTFGTDGGMGAMAYLTALVEEGKYKLPTNIEVVGKGLDSIEPALGRLMQGTSGLKFIVSL